MYFFQKHKNNYFLFENLEKVINNTTTKKRGEESVLDVVQEISSHNEINIVLKKSVNMEELEIKQYLMKKQQINIQNIQIMKNLVYSFL